MGRWRVLVTSRAYARRTPEALKLLQDGGCDICWGEAEPMDERSLTAALPGCSAALVYSSQDRFTDEALAGAPGLRVLSRHGVGYDNIDVAAATRLGVAVAITRGAGEEAAVAEHALALMMALAKGLLPHHRVVTSGRWERPTGRLLFGSVLGIVGLGRVGKELARRGRALGMQVLAYEPYRPDQAFAADVGVQFTSLEVLLASSRPAARGSLSTGLPCRW